MGSLGFNNMCLTSTYGRQLDMVPNQRLWCHCYMNIKYWLFAILVYGLEYTSTIISQSRLNLEVFASGKLQVAVAQRIRAFDVPVLSD